MSIQVENMFSSIVEKRQTPRIGILAKEGTEKKKTANFVKCLVFAYICVYRG